MTTTDAQVKAWRTLRNITMTEEQRDALAEIGRALPVATTNPLPTEPGTLVHGGRTEPRTLFRLTDSGAYTDGGVTRVWIDTNGGSYTDDEAREELGDTWEGDIVPTRELILATIANTTHVIGFSNERVMTPGQEGTLADAIVEALTIGGGS
jgi:hypothetical protein